MYCLFIYLFAVAAWSQVVNGVFGQQVSGWLWSSFHETCPIHTNLWSIFVVSLYIIFNIRKALFNFIFYQALTNLVPKVLSFLPYSGSWVGEGPGKEAELWLLQSCKMSSRKCLKFAQSWCFVMAEGCVGGNLTYWKYLRSKIIFSLPNPF